jgi:hypothetical protein
VFLEAVVIVGSILAAFGIDAAWSERQERVDERAAIGQLSADFAVNAARLDTLRTTHELALASSLEILALAGWGGETEETQLSGELIRNSFRVWTYDPVLGGINSLIQSGNLGILRNEDLRVAIAGWPDLVRDLKEDEERERATVFDRFAPYFEEQGVMFDLLADAGRLDALGSRPRADLSVLLRDSRYLQMISWRVNNLQNVLDEVESVDRSVQRIRQLLGTYE